MNRDTYPSKVGILSSPLVKAFLERLKRLARKLGTLGYSKSDINQIVLKTFLDLPCQVNWFDLSNTDLYYSLKTKIEFKSEDSDLILAISKCFLSCQEESEELARKLINKLQFSCEVFGFDLQNDDSVSSQDSSTFLQIYKNKLNTKYKNQNTFETKRTRLRSKSKPPVKKRVYLEQAKPRKKIVKQQESLVFPPIQKKQKPEE